MSQPASPEFKSWCEDRLSKLLEASNAIIADGTQHPAMLVVDGYQPDQTAVVPLDMDNHENKDIAHGLQRHMASNANMVASATIITEAWMLTVRTKKDDPPPRMPSGSLEHAPGRTECILYSFMRGDQQLFVACPIDRTNNAVSRGEFVDAASGQLGGRMVNDNHTLH